MDDKRGDFAEANSQLVFASQGIVREDNTLARIGLSTLPEFYSLI